MCKSLARCAQEKLVAVACLALFGMSAVGQASYAQEILATGLGFVDRDYPDDPEQTDFRPASIFRTAEGRLYLLTSSLVIPENEQLCFVQNGVVTIAPDKGWFEDTTQSAILYGPEVCAYHIPEESLGDSTKKVFDQVAVNEADFVAAQVGLPVRIQGRTHGLHTADQDYEGIIAASGHVGYEAYFSKEFQTPKIDYNVMLPASSGCPPMSWVYLNQQPHDSQSACVGLIIHHMSYKTGHCFLDIDDLKLICKSDLMKEMFNRQPTAVSATTGKSGLVYHLDKMGQMQADNWKAHGAVSNELESLFMSPEVPDPQNMGIVCNLILLDDKYYLIVDAIYATRLLADSSACFRVSGDIHRLKISDCFAWSADQRISIDSSLVALPSRNDVEMPAWLLSAAQRLDSAMNTEEEDLDAIFGMSHTDGVLRKRIEESLVYYLDITFTQEAYGLKPVPSFNAGIYPTVLFGVKNNRPQPFGILAFNRLTQEPAIYSTAELRAFLTPK